MRYFLIILAILVIPLLLYILLKILPFLTAKPLISVDYLTEYNEATKPAKYDPNENAAIYYEKAFEAFVEIPESIKQFQQAWPGDMNETELNTLKKWLASNSETLGYLRQAAQKPYCWIERQSTDDAIFNIELPEVSKLREAVWCFNLQTKFAAFEGKIEQAFDQVIELHKIGTHYSGPVTLVEQLVGTAINGVAFNTAFAILDRQEVDFGTLANFQNQLEQQLKQAGPLNFSIGERIYGLDITQRLFTDDGSGDGLLIPGKLLRIKKYSWSTPSISYPKAVLICLHHPGRRETLELSQRLYRNLGELVSRTPWQLHQKGTSYEDEIREMMMGNYLLIDLAFSTGKVCEIYQRKKTHGKALVATLAVLRHKIDKSKFPDDLQDLATAGYIETVPTDLYSGKPLVYKLVNDGFTLYSIGADFNDDGGVYSDWGEGEEGGDMVFWPVEKY